MLYLLLVPSDAPKSKAISPAFRVWRQGVSEGSELLIKGGVAYMWVRVRVRARARVRVRVGG